MRKFRLTRDMVQAAPGGSTVVYTEEQVKAIRECALTRENQGRLLEYVAAGGHLSLVWLHSTISPESPNYSSAPRRSLYTLHLCATPKNVEPGKEYSLLSMMGVDAVEVLDTLFFEAPETYNLRNPAKPVPGATHLHPFVGMEEEMLNRHGLTRHDITLTLPPDSNKVIKPTDRRLPRRVRTQILSLSPCYRRGAKGARRLPWHCSAQEFSCRIPTPWWKSSTHRAQDRRRAGHALPIVHQFQRGGRLIAPV